MVTHTHRNWLFLLTVLVIWPVQVHAAESGRQDQPATAVAHYNSTRAGRFSEAVQSYQQGLGPKSDDADAYSGLGLAYTGLGQHEKAVEAVKQAIALRPDDADAHLKLGLSYLLLHQYSEAIKTLEEAVKLKPKFAEAHFALGAAYDQQGDQERAFNQYRILKSLNPDLAGEMLRKMKSN